MKKKWSDKIKEKAIGIIASLLIVFILFIVGSFSKGIKDCGDVKRDQKNLMEDVKEKVDQTEFEYYKRNVDDKVDMILELLKEIKQDIKEIRKQ